MGVLKKKVLSVALAGTFLFSSAVTFAAGEPSPPPQPNISEIAKEVAAQYDVNEKEVLDALKEEKPLDDIYYAAMLSKISGKSFRQVFAMKSDWFDVMKNLGITREKYEEVLKEMMAEDIAARSDLDIKTVQKLMEQHYLPRDIRIAGRLAKASGKNVQAVLDMKKLNKRWFDVAKDLKVDPQVIRPRTPAEEAEDQQTEQPQQPEQEK